MATAGTEPSGASGYIGSSTGTRKMASTEGLGNSSSQAMKKTIGHRGIDPTGETTYKKTPSSALKGAIQLGITHTVGSLTQKPERDVLMQDFEVVESIFFPGEGSNLTPAHHYSDFRFKTYAPIAFRYFREMFGIRPDDYLYSLCNEPLIELSNSGASGSIFYVSSDDEFIIKTVQHKEAEFLQKLLPGYFMTLNQNKRTLLPKFYGLYCVQAGGKNIRIIVMNNLLPRAIKMHLKYDLKGSTHKRRASSKERDKAMPTYKDLDFVQDMPDGLLLEADKYNALSKTIQRDCRMLQSFKIMDYSLLVVIHNLDQTCREQDSEDAVAEAVDQRRPGQKTLYSTAIEAIQGEARGMGSLDTEDHMGGIPARNMKGERLLVYIGIIDILQSYRLVKKLEHSWKALVHDGDTVSVHRPGFYAERFQKFMCNIVFRKISLKTSPSKKSRAGVLVGQRRPNAVGAGPALPAPASSGTAVQQSISVDADAETEGDSGIQSGRPDLLPKTSTHTVITSNSVDTTLSNSVDTTLSNSVDTTLPSAVETTLSSSPVENSELAPTNQALPPSLDTCKSVGEELNVLAPTNQDSPPSSDTCESPGEEANESASTDQEHSTLKSIESLEDSTESADVISLNDIVPHTNKCQV